ASVLPAEFKTSAAPHIDLTAIDYLVGSPTLKLDADKPGPDGEPHGRMTTGLSELEIRFHDGINLYEWMREQAPAIQRTTSDSLSYYSYSVSWMGSTPVYVAARDSRTIACTFDLDRLKQAYHETRDWSTSKEAAQWSDLDGGLATMLLTDAK